MNKALIISLVLSSSLFALSVALGYLFPLPAVTDILRQFVGVLQPLELASSVSLALFIFLNNSIKVLGVIILGFLLGIPPFIFICANGLIIGAVISIVMPEVGPTLVVASLAPHGVIEIPLVLLGTALGILIGWESIVPQAGQTPSVAGR